MQGIAPTLIIVRVGTNHSPETACTSAAQTAPLQIARPVTSTMWSTVGDNIDSPCERRVTTSTDKTPGHDHVDQLDESQL
ncbi:hypothetical protein EVG20_g3019 [Dentipellis fragilis]|uniref:Uncharacterized protein n=1 Tax=Dentipellis fragilis TaxID=205917 RepID=A0A4Y9Z4W9_9AGAM|nr:hypothetical protein EVG20_g3019 [Dentipellis fragilis]